MGERSGPSFPRFENSRNVEGSKKWTSHFNPSASCLSSDFALFYVEITSTGSPDPVTSLILHHRPD